MRARPLWAWGGGGEARRGQSDIDGGPLRQADMDINVALLHGVHVLLIFTKKAPTASTKEGGGERQSPLAAAAELRQPPSVCGVYLWPWSTAPRSAIQQTAPPAPLLPRQRRRVNYVCCLFGSFGRLRQRQTRSAANEFVEESERFGNRSLCVCVCVPLALPRKTGWQRGASDTKKAERGTNRVIVLAFPVHFQGCVAVNQNTKRDLSCFHSGHKVAASSRALPWIVFACRATASRCADHGGGGRSGGSEVLSEHESSRQVNLPASGAKRCLARSMFVFPIHEWTPGETLRTLPSAV